MSMWDFLKKFKKGEPDKRVAAASVPRSAPESAVRTQETGAAPAPQAARPAATSPVETKSHEQKTDDELAEELNKMSPEILSQAKTPQMRKMVIDLYRKMLVAGVNVKDEKEVKKWIKKHPEAVEGGEVRKVETVKRTEPKVGRNDPCTCGSGKKYKKCCGVGKS